MNLVQTFIDQHYDALPLAGMGIPRRLGSALLTPRFQASRHVIFLLFQAGSLQPVLVAKVARLTGTSASLEQEARVLSAIQAAHPSGLDSVPKLVAFESVGEHAMLIETAILGIHMKPSVVRQDTDGCCAMALDWLVEMHGLDLARDRDDWFPHLVTQPLGDFTAAFPVGEAEQQLLDQTRALLEPLRSIVLHLSVEHGDLSHPNLFIRPAGGMGVVDWELARTDGLSLCDLFFFLSFVAFSLDDANRTGAYLASFERAFFGGSAWAAPYIRRYAERVGLARQNLAPLFVLCWARYTSHLVRRVQGPSADGDGLGPALAEWIRENRYYQMWRYSLEHHAELNWAHAE